MYTTQDLLYFVLSLSALWITVFLCWALYEVALLVRRSRLIVDNVTDKIQRVEKAVQSISGLLASGGEIVGSLLQKKNKKTK